eukprot:jgi/Ulvmu1/2591/UM014_0042.1
MKASQKTPLRTSELFLDRALQRSNQRIQGTDKALQCCKSYSDRRYTEAVVCCQYTLHTHAQFTSDDQSPDLFHNVKKHQF